MPNKRIDLRLQISGEADTVENFRRLQRYFDGFTPLEGFTCLSFELPAGASQVKIKHGLTYVPKDVILSRLIAQSGVKLTVHHGLFDRDNIVVSASGALKARILVGTYQPQSGDDATVESTETQVFVGQP